MIWPLVAGGIQLGATLYDAYRKKKNKPKLGENTFAGRELARISREGALSPGTMAGINQLTSTLTGGTSNVAKSNVRGQLIRSGMSDSIAGTNPLRQIDTERTRALADAGFGMLVENERTKQNASMELADLKDSTRETRRQWRDDFYGGLAGGVGSSAMNIASGVQNWQNQKTVEGAFTSINDLVDAATESGDIELMSQALDQLTLFIGRYGNMLGGSSPLTQGRQ